MRFKQLYERIYEDPSYHGGFEEFKFVEIVKYTGNASGLDVLEIGVGDQGGILSFLRSKSKEGWDISERAINRLPKQFNGRVVNIEQDTKIPAKYYDRVYLLDVLEHLFDTEFVLSRIHKLLNHDGELILSIPNDVMQLPKRLKMFTGTHGMFEPQLSGHIRYFHTRSLRAWLIKCGFRNIRIYGIGKVPFCKYLPNLLASHYCVIARR